MLTELSANSATCLDQGVHKLHKIPVSDMTACESSVHLSVDSFNFITIIYVPLQFAAIGAG